MAGKSEGFSTAEGLGFAWNPRLDRAYAEGREACAVNVVAINPHMPGTDEWKAWEKGFVTIPARQYETAIESASVNAYLVSSTGTKTTGVSNLSDDPATQWANANCYATVEAAMNAAATTGRCVVVNDETITETGQALDTVNAANKLITLRSRSGDPTVAKLSLNSATAYLMNVTDNNNSAPKSFQGLGFTSAVSKTNVTPFIQLQGTSTTTLRFKDCRFGGFNHNADTSSNNGVLMAILSTSARDVIFEDCEFHDMGVDQPTDISWIKFSGTQRRYILKRVTFRNMTNVVDADTSSAWCFQLENANTYIFDQCKAIANEVTVEATGVNPRPWAYMGSAEPTVYIRSFKYFSSVVGDETNTPDANGWGFYISGDHFIDGLESYNCTHYYGESAFDGGQLYLNGSSADGLAINLKAVNCTSRSGCAVFSSNGANSVVGNVTAINCVSEAGPIYSGGVGDFTVDGAIVEGCTIDNDGAIFARVNGSTRNKEVLIKNARMSGNTTTGGSTAGIKFETANTVANVLTATARGCIVLNADDTYSYESATGADIDGFTIDCVGDKPTSGTTDTNYVEV
jgi:hypothetical protein